MNPIVFNCIFLYLAVIALSLIQSRFRLVKDNPIEYLMLLLIGPFIVLGKAKGIKTWTGLTGMEIFGYTLFITFLNPKRILPRINEGYIYAYTLFHWYLLFDTFLLKGLNFWTGLVLVLSVYPTYLIIRSSFESKKLIQRDKIILYYWFLFTIAFTYADQVALDLIEPVVALDDISIRSSSIVMFSAVQLYFVSTMLSLLFVGIPFFHLDRTSDTWNIRWKRVMDEWGEVLKHKLDSYVEYQINFAQVVYVTLMSAVLFYIDRVENFRQVLIFCYTVVFPLVFFYLRWTPKTNLETEV
jgi:hypothetical protein